MNTNQYSVTMHKRDINHMAGESGLPGVFFMCAVVACLLRVLSTFPTCGNSQPPFSLAVTPEFMLQSTAMLIRRCRGAQVRDLTAFGTNQ